MNRLFLLLLVVCSATHAADSERLASVQRVKVVEAGVVESASDSKLCRGFRLSHAAASKILKHAVVITPNERHYQFLWSPCFVKGVATVGGRPVQWRIEALGLVSVTFEDGVEVLLGDDSQRVKGGQ